MILGVILVATWLLLDGIIIWYLPRFNSKLN